MTKPSRILICGGRDYSDLMKFEDTLSSCLPFIDNDFCIIQGGQRGADTMAKTWANENGVPCIQVSANWDYYGKRAGMLRNEWMIRYCNPDLVIAFPGGVGTKGMLHLARYFNIPFYEVD